MRDYGYRRYAFVFIGEWKLYEDWGQFRLQSLSGLAQDKLRADGEGADRVGTETASR